LPWPLAITSTARADAIDWPDTARPARHRPPGPTPPARPGPAPEGRLADVLFLVKINHESSPGRTIHPIALCGSRPPHRPTMPGRCGST